MKTITPAAALAIFASGRPYEHAADLAAFATNKKNLNMFLDIIDGGVELPHKSANYFAAMHGKIREVRKTRYQHLSMFTDDTRFTNTRFYLTTDLWTGSFAAETFRDQSFEAAGEQLQRMLAAGRFDLPYGDLFEKAAQYKNPDLATLLFAYTPGRIDHFKQQVLDINGVRGTTNVEKSARAILSDEIFYQAATTMYRMGFRDTWLRSALSNTEYDQVRNFDLDLLQRLYPTVWAAGYEGHRQRMLTQPTAGIA